MARIVWSLTPRSRYSDGRWQIQALATVLLLNLLRCCARFTRHFMKKANSATTPPCYIYSVCRSALCYAPGIGCTRRRHGPPPRHLKPLRVQRSMASCELPQALTKLAVGPLWHGQPNPLPLLPVVILMMNDQGCHRP